MGFATLNPSYGSTIECLRSVVHERMVDDRLLLGGQGLVELLERRLDLLQSLQPRREELLAPVDPVEDRPLTAVGGRQRGTELALPFRRGLQQPLQLVG